MRVHSQIDNKSNIIVTSVFEQFGRKTTKTSVEQAKRVICVGLIPMSGSGASGSMANPAFTVNTDIMAGVG